MAYLDGITRLGPGGSPRSPVSFSAAEATAVITGTASSDLLEAELVAGTQTIIITLTNDTWVATSGGTFNAQRQAIIDGLDAASSPALGWNDEIRDKEVVGSVSRDSDTVVTITLTASPLYSLADAASETITMTVPAAALVTSSGAVTATPTFDVSADAVVTTGGRTKRRKRYVVEVDNKLIQVANIAEAESVLAQVRELAEQSAEQDVTTAVTPKPPRVSVKTSSGNPTTSKVIQREVKRTQKTINRAYIQASKRRATDMEISKLMTVKIHEEEDEEAIIALLLM